MTVPVLPSPWGAHLADYLQKLEDRIGRLESPQQAQAMFTVVSANLNTANAATYAFCQVLVTDLNIIAHSSGAHWIREDTGGVIV